jgi:BirA family biotin operon repressor/biotin-[acetyl-CoA-carboxylase] ligase
MSTSPGERPLVQRVFQCLSDGEFHSGEALAARLDVTRAAVWKAVEQLRELGLKPEGQPNRGYRLPRGVNALEIAEIEAQLSASSRALIDDLRLEWSLASTNDSLLAGGPTAPNRARALLVEHQTGGRGRGGRTWIAPPGGAICLSIGWSFAELPRDISALALAIGVCVQRALASCAAAAVRLKWPNDLVVDRGKVGGILLELHAEAAGPAYVVIGIGINVLLTDTSRAAVAAAGGQAIDYLSIATTPERRSVLAGHVIEECLTGLTRFRDGGFGAFLPAWNALDSLRGVEVVATRGGGTLRGVARGVDVHGQLLVEAAGHITSHALGDVSVRRDVL